LIFSFLTVSKYLAFPSKYCVLRCYLSSSLFLVLWYLRLSTFTLFRIIVSSTLHQRTDLFDIALFEARRVLKDFVACRFHGVKFFNYLFSVHSVGHMCTVFYLSLLSLFPFLPCRASFLPIEVGFLGISVYYPFALYTSLLGSRVQSCCLCLGLWRT